MEDFHTYVAAGNMDKGSEKHGESHYFRAFHGVEVLSGGFELGVEEHCRDEEVAILLCISCSLRVLVQPY